MCEIVLSNLNDEQLNKRLALLLMSLGSGIHNDGWGVVGNDGGSAKCAHPAYCTTDLGSFIKNTKTMKRPFLAHIRKASTSVPVENKNSHPFTHQSMNMVHNGTLELKNKEGVVVEYKKQVKEWNNIKKEQQLVEKTFKVSDSKLFFDEFKKLGTPQSDSQFVEHVIKTVEKFDGKFAFGFYLHNLKTHYLVRGKTAKLHIIYMKDSDDKNASTIGFAVDTNKRLLETCIVLLSNLHQLSTGKELFFTEAIELPEETIFKVGKLDVEIIGEVKETTATTNFTKAWKNGTRSSTTVTTSTPSPTMKDLEENTKTVFEFARSNSLTFQDIQTLFMGIYKASVLEVTPEYLSHFVKKVIPNLQGRVNKKLRKKMLKASDGYIPHNLYYKKEYTFPWMLNSPATIGKIIKEVEELGKI